MSKPIGVGPKPYLQIQAALDQWRGFDDPARADLKGKRRRRIFGVIVLGLLGTISFGLGLTVVALIHEYQAHIDDYTRHVADINAALETQKKDAYEDVESRLSERRAQLTKLSKSVEAAEAKARELRADRELIQSKLEAAGDDPGSMHALMTEFAGVEANLEREEQILMELRTLALQLEKGIGFMEAELADFENDEEAIARERASRQEQVEDDLSNVTALEADLEIANRRVMELIKENKELRALSKELIVQKFSDVDAAPAP